MKIDFVFYRLLIISMIFIGSISSCKVSKYLEPGQKLFNEVDFNITAPHQDYNKSRIESGLRYYLQQSKNGEVLGIPKEWIYLRHNKISDSSRYDVIMRKVFGEEPSIYDEQKTIDAEQAMKSWLRFNKGFYQAEVTHKTKDKGIKRNLEFDVKLGKRYKYGDITFLGRDTNLVRIIEELWNYEYIHPGSFVDRDAYSSEVARITSILQNMGYANFASKYFDVKGDSTNGNGTIKLFVEVYSPENSLIHQKYNVGDIHVYTDFYSKQDTFGLTQDTVNGIVYKKESAKFLVDPKVIDKVIYFKSGDLVKKDQRVKTFSKLSNLSTYRFTTINPKPNIQDSLVIDYDILLTPHPYKWIGDGGVDFSYSTLGRNSVGGSIGRNLLGLSLNGQLQNRNLLGGSEFFSISAEAGSQIELSSPIRFRTFNYSLASNLDYPIFKDHLKQAKLLNTIGLISNRGFYKLQQTGQSTINFSINNTSIRDFYRIFIINSSYGYKITDKPDRSLNMSTLGFSLNSYDLEALFLDLIQNNDLLVNTFRDNLFTGLLFRNVVYTRTGYFPNPKWEWSMFASSELSGVEVLGLNKLFNTINNNEVRWSLGQEGRYTFAQFAKVELDGRFFYRINKNNTLAYRINTGIALPFGYDSAIPFIKQFDAGGPNSMRGWAPRQLGPGATQVDFTNIILPFQKGDIKLETNLEYRFPIYWFFKGVLFTDVGNVWTLRDDNDAGKFTEDFYKQIAIASGWGLRMDFDYFLIRFDFGYRIRNPYKIIDDQGSRYWYNWNDFKGQRLGNVQVAINHTF